MNEGIKKWDEICNRFWGIYPFSTYEEYLATADIDEFLIHNIMQMIKTYVRRGDRVNDVIPWYIMDAFKEHCQDFNHYVEIATSRLAKELEKK